MFEKVIISMCLGIGWLVVCIYRWICYRELLIGTGKVPYNVVCIYIYIYHILLTGI